MYAVRGGNTADALGSGTFFSYLYTSSTFYGWGRGAALVYQNRKGLEKYCIRGGNSNYNLSCGIFFISLPADSYISINWSIGAAQVYQNRSTTCYPARSGYPAIGKSCGNWFLDIYFVSSTNWGRGATLNQNRSYVNNYSSRGGNTSIDFSCGTFCIDLYDRYSFSGWVFGATISYKFIKIEFMKHFILFVVEQLIVKFNVEHSVIILIIDQQVLVW